jgi:hypothetical protein
MPELVSAQMLGSEGKQRQVARSLDRDGQAALMPRACSTLAPALDLASLRDEAAQDGHVFVIDCLGLF